MVSTSTAIIVAFLALGFGFLAGFLMAMSAKVDNEENS